MKAAPRLALCSTFRACPEPAPASSSDALVTWNTTPAAATVSDPPNGIVRWYDPVTGRWLSNDPIGISGGLNQYVFCDNNPVNYEDPFGRTVQDPHAAGLGFTTGDILRAMRRAQQLGIGAPYGLSWSSFWNALQNSTHEIRWQMGQEDCVANTAGYSGGSRSTIVMPRNARPGLESIHASNTANLFYFESAVLHELTHAYQQMKDWQTRLGWFGPDDVGDSETWPCIIGDAMEKALGGANR